jgi:tetrapyrrole methylase family protein/MazG family protein
MAELENYPHKFDGLVAIITLLRDPIHGCPWDLAQTHQSLRPSLLEECFEVLEAIDEGDPIKLSEELGDLLLQVVFHAQIAAETAEFTLSDIFKQINEKLVRRHPHVFADAQASTPEEVETHWEEVKRAERTGTRETQSMLDGIPRTMPALAYSRALQERAARVGFDWENVDGVLQKVHEEHQELLNAQSQQQQELEMGDLLFTMVNLSRWLKVDAESALRKSALRFYKRFALMESYTNELGVNIQDLPMDEKDVFWEQAKNDLTFC